MHQCVFQVRSPSSKLPLVARTEWWADSTAPNIPKLACRAVSGTLKLRLELTVNNEWPRRSAACKFIYIRVSLRCENKKIFYLAGILPQLLVLYVRRLCKFLCPNSFRTRSSRGLASGEKQRRPMDPSVCRPSNVSQWFPGATHMWEYSKLQNVSGWLHRTKTSLKRSRTFLCKPFLDCDKTFYTLFDGLCCTGKTWRIDSCKRCPIEPHANVYVIFVCLSVQPRQHTGYMKLEHGIFATGFIRLGGIPSIGDVKRRWVRCCWRHKFQQLLLPTSKLASDMRIRQQTVRNLFMSYFKSVTVYRRTGYRTFRCGGVLNMC